MSDSTPFQTVLLNPGNGAGCRPLDLAWVRDIRDRCASQDAAFFFKQVGGPTPKAGGRQLDGRTWDEYPAAGQRARAATA